MSKAESRLELAAGLGQTGAVVDGDGAPAVDCKHGQGYGRFAANPRCLANHPKAFAARAIQVRPILGSQGFLYFLTGQFAGMVGHFRLPPQGNMSEAVLEEIEACVERLVQDFHVFEFVAEHGPIAEALIFRGGHTGAIGEELRDFGGACSVFGLTPKWFCLGYGCGKRKSAAGEGFSHRISPFIQKRGWYGKSVLALIGALPSLGTGNAEVLQCAAVNTAPEVEHLAAVQVLADALEATRAAIARLEAQRDELEERAPPLRNGPAYGASNPLPEPDARGGGSQKLRASRGKPPCSNYFIANSEFRGVFAVGGAWKSTASSD